MTYKIIDNFLEDETFKKLKRQLISSTFPWFFLNSTSYPKEMDFQSDNLTYSFSHSVVLSGRKTESMLYNILKPVLIDSLKKNSEDVTSLERVRVNCLLNTNRKWLHTPHIDAEEKHKTAILYIHGDGNTVIFSEKFDLDSGMNSYDYYKTKMNEHITVEKECQPKENRLFCFDGLHYHSAYNPMISSRRIVIAFNYK